MPTGYAHGAVLHTRICGDSAYTFLRGIARGFALLGDGLARLARAAPVSTIFITVHTSLTI